MNDLEASCDLRSLIATGIALYFAKWPILIIAALAGIFRGVFWLIDRYPRTMTVVLFVFEGTLRK